MSVALFIILPITGAAACWTLLALRWRRRRATHRQVFNDLFLPNVSDARFASRDVALLPPPVARFFLHSIPADRPLARTVDLDFVGEIRSSPDAAWLRFEARQRVCPDRGFLWQARLEGLGPIAAEGAEFLIQGRAAGHYCLGGWLPLLRRSDEHNLRVAAERLMIESFWLPSSVLPEHGVRWQQLDDDRATAVFPTATGSTAVNVVIDEHGALSEMSLVRLRRAGDGAAGMAPYGIRFHGSDRFDGYAIPHRAVAMWDYGTDDAFECLRLEVETARFY